MLGVETRIVYYYTLIYAKERRQVKMKDVYLSFRITERYNTWKRQKKSLKRTLICISYIL